MRGSVQLSGRPSLEVGSGWGRPGAQENLTYRPLRPLALTFLALDLTTFKVAMEKFLSLSSDTAPSLIVGAERGHSTARKSCTCLVFSPALPWWWDISGPISAAESHADLLHGLGRPRQRERSKGLQEREQIFLQFLANGSSELFLHLLFFPFNSPEF